VCTPVVITFEFPEMPPPHCRAHERTSGVQWAMEQHHPSLLCANPAEGAGGGTPCWQHSPGATSCQGLRSATQRPLGIWWISGIAVLARVVVQEGEASGPVALEARRPTLSYASGMAGDRWTAPGLRQAASARCRNSAVGAEPAQSAATTATACLPAAAGGEEKPWDWRCVRGPFNGGELSGGRCVELDEMLKSQVHRYLRGWLRTRIYPCCDAEPMQVPMQVTYMWEAHADVDAHVHACTCCMCGCAPHEVGWRATLQAQRAATSGGAAAGVVLGRGCSGRHGCASCRSADSASWSSAPDPRAYPRAAPCGRPPAAQPRGQRRPSRASAR
jgi:hypothetical protein